MPNPKITERKEEGVRNVSPTKSIIKKSRTEVVSPAHKSTEKPVTEVTDYQYQSMGT